MASKIPEDGSMVSSGPSEPGMTLLQVANPSLADLAGAFALPGPVSRVEPLGNGNVNDTYRVTCQGGEQFVLQRLNSEIFSRPEHVMANLASLSDHTGQRPWPQRDQPRRWELPRLVPNRLKEAADPNRYCLEREGRCWRLLTYVTDSICHDTVTCPGQATEVGRALGAFHHLVHDLPCGQLHDTLEGFHITPCYLATYDSLEHGRSLPLDDAERYCQAFIRSRRQLAPVLEEAKSRGVLKLRPIHGDPKVNNVLLDRNSGRAVALVDLDTVKPGLLHYDIGDALRSGCNPAGEDCTDLGSVRFDLELSEAMLSGYLELARPILSPADIDYIPDAAKVISFELGLRFYSDHLAGNQYFKCQHPNHNLDRALVQFKLTESIEAQSEKLVQLIDQLR